MNKRRRCRANHHSCKAHADDVDVLTRTCCNCHVGDPHAATCEPFFFRCAMRQQSVDLLGKDWVKEHSVWEERPQ